MRAAPYQGERRPPDPRWRRRQRSAHLRHPGRRRRPRGAPHRPAAARPRTAGPGARRGASTPAPRPARRACAHAGRADRSPPAPSAGSSRSLEHASFSSRGRPQLAQHTPCGRAGRHSAVRSFHKARSLLVELQASLRASVGQVRQLARDLRPPVLDELGLLAAVRERARQFDADLQVTVDAA